MHVGRGIESNALQGTPRIVSGALPRQPDACRRLHNLLRGFGRREQSIQAIFDERGVDIRRDKIRIGKSPRQEPRVGLDRPHFHAASTPLAKRAAA